MNRKQPRILPTRSNRELAEAIRQAVACLKQGSLIIVPTDTVYGVAADARIAGAEERIYQAKGRDRGKPIPLLAADLDQVKACGAEMNALEDKLARTFWPGPLTLVLKVGPASEGFRVPDHAVARALLEAAGGVLRVTSANASGEPPALTAGDAVRALGPFVEAVVDAGRAPGGVPSTVVRVDAGKIVVLRAGAIPEAALTAL